MADLSMILRNGVQVAAPRKTPVIPLGRWSGTSVASLAADNVFDDSVFSSYQITGQFLPATDSVNFLAVLRSSTPADVSGGLKCGGSYAQLDGATAGVGTNFAALMNAVGSASGGGITAFEMSLHMRNGLRHGFRQQTVVVISGGTRYSIAYSGEFIDTTPRQGIKFSFSSGNIAEGWFEILGIQKQ